MTNRSLIIAFILASGDFIRTAASQACYWPNGAVAPGFQPCNKPDGTGPCCFMRTSADRDPCFSNGLCYSQLWGHVYRGACTSPFWENSTGCTRSCLDVNTKGPATLFPCGPRNVCCGDMNYKNDTQSFCFSPKHRLQMKNASITNNRVVDCSKAELTQELKTNLGIGLGVGLPTLIVAVIGLWVKCFKKKKTLKIGNGDSASEAPSRHGSEASMMVVARGSQTPGSVSPSGIETSQCSVRNEQR